MEVEQIEEQKLINLGSYDILQNITNSQNQNGFKHGDYKRYRNYCKKKTLKLRIKMKIKYGRNKYQAKNIITEKPNEPKIVPVLLYNAERNWSYGLDLKSNKSQIKNEENRRRKFHIRKKFKKAIFYATQLENLCAERLDDRTSLEAKAYNYYLKGQYYFETKNYSNAQSNFLESRQILSELNKLSNSYMQIVFNDKIEQIDQNIRYCSHQLSTGLQTMSIEEILKLKSKTNEDSVLNEKLEQMLQESRAKKLQDIKQKDVNYNNEKITIINPKVIIQLQKLEEFQFKLNNTEQNNFELKMQIYIEIFAVFDEINRILIKEKEEQKDQEQIILMIQKTIAYFTLQKQIFIYDRNYYQFLNAEKRFIQENTIDLLDQQISKRQLKTKLVQPIEMIRWSENLLTALRNIQELEKNNDINQFKKLEFEEIVFRNIKTIYIATLYYQNKKFLEAASLFNYLETLFINSKSFYQKNYELRFNFEEIYKQKIEQINYYKSKSIAQLQEQSIQNEQKAILNLQQVNLEGKQNNQSLELLLKSEDVHNQINLNNLQKTQICDLNPELNMISARPIFLDLSYNQLKYPDITSKIQQEQGLIGKVWKRFSIFGK